MISDHPAANPWLVRPRQNPDARVRLVGFPFAGGGPSLFRAWPDGLPATIEVWAVQAPGREARYREPGYRDVRPLVSDLADALVPELEAPFAFFGHSLGALIAFELARELRRRNLEGPVRLFASGRNAPQLPRRHPMLHDLPEDEFRRELRRLEGTPREVLEHEELMQVLSPLLRADFAVNETYRYPDEPPLDCPITALGGRDDPRVDRDGIEAWRDQTNASFTARMLPGNHFFVQSARELVLSIVGRTLARGIRRQ